MTAGAKVSPQWWWRPSSRHCQPFAKLQNIATQRNATPSRHCQPSQNGAHCTGHQWYHIPIKASPPRSVNCKMHWTLLFKRPPLHSVKCSQIPPNQLKCLLPHVTNPLWRCDVEEGISGSKVSSCFIGKEKLKLRRKMFFCGGGCM